MSTNRMGRFGRTALFALLVSTLALPVRADVTLEQIEATQQVMLKRLDQQDRVLQEILKQREATAAAARGPDPDKVYSIPLADSPVRGKGTAKLTLVEFSDFQCPYCAKARPLIDELMKAYPQDVNFVYKEYPLTSIHQNAMIAAKAHIAAGLQGKYWEMHDRLFENRAQLGEDKVRDIARALGLDMDRFEKDLQSDEVSRRVSEDVQLAKQMGVRGTPTIFLDGQLLEERDPDALKQMILKKLDSKS